LQVFLVSEDKKGKNHVSLKVDEVMTFEVITIDEKATVKEAADIMDKNEISCLIVARKGRAIGIITERDLLKRVIVEAKNPEKTKVKAVMSTPLEVVASGTDLEDAIKMMFQKKIKKMPVVDKDNIIGLVSLTDIARCQPAIIKLLKSFAASQDTPESMKKVLKYYIV
jgi:CBS domain-containing protein